MDTTIVKVKKTRVQHTKRKGWAGIKEYAGKGGASSKGVKKYFTVEREKILEEIKDIGASRAKTLINVQTMLAVGSFSVYAIQMGNKPILIKDDEVIIKVLDREFGTGEEVTGVPKGTLYFISKQQPDNGAINSILDRTFGRATESKKLTIGSEIDEETRELARGAVRRYLESK